jgi:SAM-dependent methyltransferase
MDLNDARTFELFLEIYGTLPRAGPGSTADSLRALSMLPNRNPTTVLDAGCGPGAQTLVLAEALPDAAIFALDTAEQLVAEARRRVEGHGFSDRVRVELGDMMAPEVPPGSLDLVWCEGAIYFAGVQHALQTWRPLLTDTGAVAFTEPVWLHPSPPDDLVAWWQEEYPAITDELGVRAAITAAGYETIGSFVLPPESWWDEYYGPMEARVNEFRAAHPDDELAAEIADGAITEINTFRSNSEHYSYAFFVVRPLGII